MIFSSEFISTLASTTMHEVHVSHEHMNQSQSLIPCCVWSPTDGISCCQLPPLLGVGPVDRAHASGGQTGQASDKARRREHLGLRSCFCFSRRGGLSLFQSPGRRSRRLLPLTTRLASALSHSHALRTIFPLFYGFLNMAS